MKIKMLVMAIIVPIVIFGGIVGTIAVDIWSTTSDKTPATYKDGEYAGVYNPEDIRGSYTFEEVANVFEVDLQILYEAFGIYEDIDGMDIKTKDLENIYENAEYEIGNESVQVFVALYKNLPIVLDDVYLPKKAVDIILKENNKLTKEQKDYIEEHMIELSGINFMIETTTESRTQTEEGLKEEQLVNGSTTFQQVLDMKITKEQIEEIIEKKIPATNQTVKDYCINEGVSFSVIKAKLTKLVEE